MRELKSNECGSKFEIADDYGDNVATMLCQLESGHKGLHRESWMNEKAICQWDDSVAENPKEKK